MIPEFLIGLYMGGVVVTWYCFGQHRDEKFFSCAMACFMWPFVTLITLFLIWRKR